MSARDTIAAISTAPGRAGIGIVRVSGEGLATLARAITGRDLTPRRAMYTSFLAADGATIDEGLAVFFGAPKSYTGEDVLELQGHGGPVVLRIVLQRCIELGARVATPGEFTQRAFLNGKLDLAQAEGVIDLIDASTAQAARSAVRSLRGEFSAKIQALSVALVKLRMLVEATLDFPEEDIDFLQQAGAREKLEALRRDVQSVLAAAQQGSLLREGIHVTLAGAPNVGKSSLLNRLAGEELAIVTDIPGTTRDPVRQGIELEGVPLHVIDTAGLRDTSDTVEQIGVERAWQAIASADVVVLVTDAADASCDVGTDVLERLPPEVPRIRVLNKIDLTGSNPSRQHADGETVVRLSAKTGAGVELLRQTLLEVVGWRSDQEGVYLARERHLTALARTAEHLQTAAAHGRQLELFAEELRLAHVALGGITGEFTSDDLLGEIFSRFCIGK